MLSDVLNARIREYAPANAIEQENMLQELMQHYVLASLARAGLFSVAMFHGGTCLRILHGMNRFSEDLDFLLKQPDPKFGWSQYLDRVHKDCSQEGIEFEMLDKSSIDTAVQKAFLKTDSVGKILLLALPFERHNLKKIRIKLEIDRNPPSGSAFETSYITFPNTAAITTQTLACGFATKAHALLCRRYVKGRDWFDFVWYISRKARPDLELLRNALVQQGPWAGQAVDISVDWFINQMISIVRKINWQAAAEDVRRFVPDREQQGLLKWSTDFFLFQLRSLKIYLQSEQ